MASDLRTEPLLATAGLKQREQDPPGWNFRQGHSGSPYAAYPSSEVPGGGHDGHDVASVLGLPETVVTPAVLTAVTRMLGELDQLRWRESHLRQRLATLESEAGRHPATPVLNRGGFLALIDDLIAARGLDGTLVVAHVEGLEQIRRRAGVAAGDAALRHLCAGIIASLRATDPLGLLDDSDFALVLMGTGPEAALAKVGELSERLRQPPFSWEGRPHPLGLSFGFHLIEASDSAETALAAADLDRRGRDN